MLDHVRGGDQVEAGVLEGERLQPCLLDVEAALAAEADRLREGLDADGLAELRVVGQVAAGPTAGVEDAGAGGQRGAGEEGGDDGAPAPEPPVAVLDFEVLLVGAVAQLRGPLAGSDSARRYLARR